MTSTEEFLDITPSPRLLEVIGDLDVPVWQCLAELIDNSFDSFAHVPDTGGRTTPMVRVVLPTDKTPLAESYVEVSDNAAGMAIESLRGALRAGYSSNDRFGSLGLFGLGFNVATARLGNRTEVRTSVAGENDWLVATIDLRDLQSREQFSVPLRREPKDDPSQAGTFVRVTNLRSEIYEILRRVRQRAQLSDVLSDVYSYLLRPTADGGLRENPVWLTVNDRRLIGTRPCTWSADRSVARRGIETPAVIRIDEELEDALACDTCGHWLVSPDATECPECRSEALSQRPRRVHGWLGIQRYLDRSDYGIDFIRNGRKILRQDKDIFAWTDPDSGRAEPEYPVELPSGQGRIVGEIHCDHVPVSYRKHDFQRDSRAWRAVVRIVRGDGPMLPKKAKERGYGENDSPLARLFAAYRRNDAGLASLIPGDSQGKNPIHEKAREWGRRFRDGVEEFQSDEIWYLAAEAHDRAKGLLGDSDSEKPIHEVREAFEKAGLGDFFDEPSGEPGSDEPTGSTPDEEPALQPTRAEYFAHLREIGTNYNELHGVFRLPRLEDFTFAAYGTQGEVLYAEDGRELPALAHMPAGARLEAFVNEDHPVFVEYGRDPLDYAILAAAQALLPRMETTPIVELLARLTCQLPSQRQTPGALREDVERLLDEIRKATYEAIQTDAQVAWQRIESRSQARAESSAQKAHPETSWEDAIASGAYVRYLPLEAVADLVENFPERLLDGGVFDSKYSTWSDDEARSRVVAELASELRALGRFADDPTFHDRDALTVVNLTMRSVRSRLATEQ